MSKILIVGANGSVGKSCVNNLKDDNDLILISRSEFDSEVEGNFENFLWGDWFWARSYIKEQFVALNHPIKGPNGKSKKKPLFCIKQNKIHNSNKV